MLIHADIGWGHHTLFYWFSVKRFFPLCFNIRVVVSSYPSMCVSTFHVGVQSIVKWQIVGFTQKTGLVSIRANRSQLCYMLLSTLNPNSPCNTFFSKTLKA
jgi:hypothetical protein